MRMMFFTSKMKEVYEEKRRLEYYIYVFELQIEHYRNHGFTEPFDIQAEINRASDVIDQFKKILHDKGGNFFERRERKSMLVAYRSIFKDTADYLEKENKTLEHSWNDQLKAEQIMAKVTSIS
jgi:hypothetical protein